MELIEQDQASRLMASGGLSILLHGSLVVVLMIAMPKLTATLNHEPVHVEVALVEAPVPATAEVPSAQPTGEAPLSKPVSPTSQPTPVPAAAPQARTRHIQQEPTPPIQRETQAVQRPVEPVSRERELVQRETSSVQREVMTAETPVQQLQPVEEAVQTPEVTDAVTKPVMESPSQEQEIHQPVVETAIKTPTAQEADSQAARHAIERRSETAPVAVERREAPAPVVQQPVEQARTEPEVLARAPLVDSRPFPPAIGQSAEQPAPINVPVQPTAPSASSPPPAASAPVESRPIAPASEGPASSAPTAVDQAPVVARSVTPSPGRKADYGWLAESLHRRIGEVRHYPSTARLNGWEGRVVLRVAIRQDGNLDSVSVVKSSGHETLDNAAMEAVRRACPLSLKHELTTPLIVVQVPINYSLNR